KQLDHPQTGIGERQGIKDREILIRWMRKRIPNVFDLLKPAAELIASEPGSLTYRNDACRHEASKEFVEKGWEVIYAQAVEIVDRPTFLTLCLGNFKRFCYCIPFVFVESLNLSI